MITYEQVRDAIIYEPKSGIIRWRNKCGSGKNGVYVGWYDKIKGYHQLEIFGRSYKAHRIIWLYMRGYLPEKQIDHINRNKEDNRWCNLREASQQCQSQNCNIAKNNTTGITGVTLRKNGKFRAMIRYNDKLISLGTYNNLTQAVFARYSAEVKYKWISCNTTSSAYNYLKERSKNVITDYTWRQKA